MMNGASELRHLPPLERRNLIQLLDHGDSWLTLAPKIPRPASSSGEGEFLITNDHMKILSPLKHHPSSSPSDALIEFWATCGRKHERPTLTTLFELAMQCNLTRIAAYVASLIGVPYVDCEDGDDAAYEKYPPMVPTHSHLDTTYNRGDDSTSGLLDHLESGLSLMEGERRKRASGGQFTSDFNDIINTTDTDTRNVNSVTTQSSVYDKLRQLGLDTCQLTTPIIPYKIIHTASGEFKPVTVELGGLLIGAGAYGMVFKANLSQHELHRHNLMLNHEHCSTRGTIDYDTHTNIPEEEVSTKYTASADSTQHSVNCESVTVAVKVLAENVDTRQFINEVALLTKFKHHNILPCLGISIDGPRLCLLYQFMPLGSLTRVLAVKRGLVDTTAGAMSPVDDALSPRSRLNVAIGTANGLVYLHTMNPVPYVHRDVKSDNILLDVDLTPKLGDFGLVRIGSSASSVTSTKTSLVTQNVIGTTVYMAPEAFRGDVSTALDAFAFGIVLLELVTGLPAFDATRQEVDILSHVDDALEDWDFRNETTIEKTSPESLDAIKSLLDKRIDWQSTQHLDLAIALLHISKLLTEQRKKHRLSVVKALDLLNDLSSKCFPQ